jgi:hypothetical protein
LVLVGLEVLAEHQAMVQILFFHPLRQLAGAQEDITVTLAVAVALAAAAVHKVRELRLVVLELLGKVLLGVTEILLPHIQLVAEAAPGLLE